MDKKKLRVLLVEDHQVVREGIVALLTEEDDLEVVGTATDGLAALKKAHETHPDVMVTDIGIPSLNGIELTRRIRKELPHISVLVLSMHDDVQIVYRAFKAGVSGYLLKGASISELCNGIRKVATGEMYFGVPRAATAPSRETCWARPRSQTLAIPSREMMTFSGLMSRWTTPIRYACESAPATCSAITRACSTP